MISNKSDPNSLCIKGYKPLTYMHGAPVLYKSGRLWKYQDGKIKEQMILQTSTWKDASRLLVRLFRREPKIMVPLGDTCFLMAWKKQVFWIDLESQLVKCVFSAREGFSDILNICPTNGEYVAVWGDYGSNPQRNEVYIYGIAEDRHVDILYTFPAGSIRHIHNIVQKKNGGFFILTGDTEEHAGIYAADEKFDCVTPLACGKQKYRAVVGFDTPQGFLYATDAVNEPNYIYMLMENGETIEVSPINGSCIYGQEYGNSYLFSTTVEPDETKRGVLSWFSKRRGTGILSDDVHLLAVGEDLKVRCVAQFEKDVYSMKFFQYGAVLFAHGKSESLWIYPVAVKYADGMAICLKVGEDNE